MTCGVKVKLLALESVATEFQRAAVFRNRAHDVLGNPSRQRCLDLQSHLNLDPRRAASSGIEPPPEKGSSTGGRLPSQYFSISARAAA